MLELTSRFFKILEKLHIPILKPLPGLTKHTTPMHRKVKRRQLHRPLTCAVAAYVSSVSGIRSVKTGTCATVLVELGPLVFGIHREQSLANAMDKSAVVPTDLDDGFVERKFSGPHIRSNPENHAELALGINHESEFRGIVRAARKIPHHALVVAQYHTLTMHLSAHNFVGCAPNFRSKITRTGHGGHETDEQ